MNPPFEYDSATGVLTWKYRQSVPHKINTRFAGKQAGYVNKDGYRWVEWSEDGVRIRHPAAIVIWFMQTGVWPVDEVDHRNRDPLDNRWENLRAATRSEQTQNRVRKKDFPYPLGVQKRGSRFQAAIAVDRKWMYLGMFATPEEAHQAYLTARERLHPRRPKE